jgi:hypothetical protein
MIISAPGDYRKAAERRLPRFLFIDGGAVTERTMMQKCRGTGVHQSSATRAQRRWDAEP